MSVRIVISDIEVDESETSLDVAERMNERLAYYAKKHPEFSFKIEPDHEHNKLIVKTATLTDGDAN